MKVFPTSRVKAPNAPNQKNRKYIIPLTISVIINSFGDKFSGIQTYVT
jgi:hypothetical protein